MNRKFMLPLLFLLFSTRAMFCCEKSCEEVVNFCVIKSKWDVSSFKRFSQEDKDKALFYLTDFANFQGVKTILEARANVNCQDEHNNTPLHRSSFRKVCPSSSFIELLECNADVHARNEYSEQPIHLLVTGSSNGDPKRLCMLLQYGADLFAKTAKGDTPLSLACRQMRVGDRMAIENIKTAIKHIQMIIRKKITKSNFLLACLSSNRRLVTKLIDKGADVDQVDSEGETGLILAMKGKPEEPDSIEDMEEVVSKLLAAEANPEIEAYDGTTALALTAHLEKNCKVKRMIHNFVLAKERMKILDWLVGGNLNLPRVLAEILLNFSGTYEPINEEKSEEKKQ